MPNVEWDVRFHIAMVLRCRQLTCVRSESGKNDCYVWLPPACVRTKLNFKIRFLRGLHGILVMVYGAVGTIPLWGETPPERKRDYHKGKQHIL